MKTTFTFILMAFTLILQMPFKDTLAQSNKSGNIWYFGNKAGLNFNIKKNGNPTPLLDGKVNTEEGCTSYSNAYGHLLFSSDGIHLYNARNQLKDTTLEGNSSSTQSAMALQNPADLTSYYLFAMSLDKDNSDAGHQGNGSLTYSKLTHVDTLDLTLLDSNKNRILCRNVGEKLCGRRNADSSFWVITKEFNDSTHSFPNFLAFKIHKNGDIDTKPVKSPAIAPTNKGNAGQIKLSPDGNFFADAAYSSNVYLYKFNADSGTITRGINLTIGNTNSYGIEFSPLSHFLYVGSDITSGQGITQFPLLNYTQSAIQHNSIVVATTTNEVVGSLQLGPDNRIYAALWTPNRSTAPNYVGVIRNPDATGAGIAGCDYEENVMLDTSGTKTFHPYNTTYPYNNGNYHLSTLSLPSFFPVFVKTCPVSAKFRIDTITCQGNHVCATVLDTTTKRVNHKWNFGEDPNEFNFDSLKACHTYSIPGTYTITDIASGSCGNDTVKHTIKVYTKKDGAIQIIGQNPFCQGESVKLTVSGRMPGDSIVWQPVNISTDTLVVKNSGTFNAVIYSKNGCTHNCLMVAVNMISAPVVTLKDTVICNGGTATLDAGAGYSSYHWSNGATTQQTTVNQTGIYCVQVTNNSGCEGSGCAKVTVSNITVAIHDTSVCVGTSVTLDAGSGYNSYKWSTGANTETITVSNGGAYSIIVTNRYGCAASDTAMLIIKHKLSAAFLMNDSICSGVKVCTLAQDTAKDVKHIWNFGDDPNAFSVGNMVCHKYSGPGFYAVTDIASNACGSDTVKHTITVSSDHDASIEVIGENPFCEGDYVKLTVHGRQPGDHIVWSPVNVTTDTLVVRNSGTFSAIVYNKNGCIDSCLAITVSMNPAPKVSLRDTAICTGGTATLDAGAGDTKYQWSTGANTRVIHVSQKGIYTVTVYNSYGCTASAKATVSSTQMDVSITADRTTICPGQTISLSTGSPCIGCTYNWHHVGSNASDGTTASITVRPNRSTTYFVNVFDSRTGCSATASIAITVLSVVQCAIIHTNPNPASISVALNYNVIGAGTASYEIYNAFGMKVASYQLNTDVQDAIIDISNLLDGIYYANTIIDGVKVETQKLVIAK